MHRILESKDLFVYKTLLRLFGDYSERFPATGLDRLFDLLLKTGIKSISKDKVALSILQRFIYTDSSYADIHSLLNIRFAELPFELRPIYVGENGKKEVAFWGKDNKVYDKIISLINFVGEASGNWVDVNGKKVSVVTFIAKEKK